jgi:L-ribulose-5-phosphate 3-epimerase
MNRRDLFKAIPALAAATQLRGQSQPKSNCKLRPGLVGYSFGKQMGEKTMTYEALIRLTSELGLDGLDTTVYWFPDKSDKYFASLRALAYKNAVNLYTLGTGIRFCQPTQEKRQATVNELTAWVQVALKLGASHIRVFGGDTPKGATEDQALEWAVEVMKRCADVAGAAGVFLGIEDDFGLSTTAEQTLALVKKADSPWVGINLDTGNFPKNGYSGVAMCIPYATSVHLKTTITDENGKEVKADWDRLFGMFASAGYKGYISLEYEGKEAPETAVPRLAPEMRRLAAKYSA